MIPFTEDAISFYATIYGGLIIGLLFDINRSLKSNFKILKCFSVVFDIVFWVLATAIIFITINAIESFDLRYYHFVALFIGFILYYNTISKFILKILNIIIRSIVLLIKNTVIYIGLISESLYYMFIYIIHFTLDVMFFIPNLFLSTKKVIKRKHRIKLKIKKKS
jgi:spore cortex biosynthesis protein YabQ